jgi:uncharacterized membrane protein YqjE
MADGPMLFRNPAGHVGLRQNIASFIASLTQFIQSRLQLAVRDSKAAAGHLVTMVVCGIAAAILLLFGYIFLLIFAIVGLAHLIGISWIWMALILALLHFAGALVCLIIARAQAKHPMFRDTATVLKEDTEWLKNLDQTKRP